MCAWWKDKAYYGRSKWVWRDNCFLESVGGMVSKTRNGAESKDRGLILIRLYEALKELNSLCTDCLFTNEPYDTLLEEYEEIYGKNAKRDSN